jgi:hypothetical protein
MRIGNWKKCTQNVGGEKKTLGKRQLRKPNRKWDNNIKTYLKGRGCEGERWTESYPMSAFGISDVESLGSETSVVFNYSDFILGEAQEIYICHSGSNYFVN